MCLCGISSRFQLLSPCTRQVTHALLTRPPLSHFLVTPKGSWKSASFDLHVLSTPPAFILSQDQTLVKVCSDSRITLAILSSFFTVWNLSFDNSLKFFFEFSGMVCCSVFNVLYCFKQLVYYIVHVIFCQALFYTFLNFLKFNGEGGIWTLAPLLTVYSLSRGAPSATWVLLQVQAG